MEIIVWIVEDDDLFRTTVADLVDESDGLRCAHAFTTCEAAIAMLEDGKGGGFCRNLSGRQPLFTS